MQAFWVIYGGWKLTVVTFAEYIFEIIAQSFSRLGVYDKRLNKETRIWNVFIASLITHI